MKGEDDLTIRGIAFATSNYSSIVCWWAWNLYCGWFCYLQKYCHKIFVCFIPYSPWNPSNITRKMPTEVERGVNQSSHSLITIFWYKVDLGRCYKSKLKEWLSTNSRNRSHVNYVLVQGALSRESATYPMIHFHSGLCKTRCKTFLLSKNTQAAARSENVVVLDYLQNDRT